MCQAIAARPTAPASSLCREANTVLEERTIEVAISGTVFTSEIEQPPLTQVRLVTLSADLLQPG